MKKVGKKFGGYEILPYFCFRKTKTKQIVNLIGSIMKTTVKKQTKVGKSYWDGNGAYQKEYETLYNSMVPASGSALTLNGELIRAVSRLAYEYLNNGNCNACEAHEIQNDSWCGDDEWEEETEYGISDYYGKFLQIIKETIKTDTVAELVECVEEIILNSFQDWFRRQLFSDENRLTYDRLVDEVVHYVLNNEDKQLSESYIKG